MSLLFLETLRDQIMFVPRVKDESNILRFRKESRYIKIVKFGLRMNGWWKGSSDRSLNIPLVVAIQCFLFSALIGSTHQLLFVPQDLNKVTELMMHIFFIAHTIITHFTLAWKQKTILKMLSLVESRFENFSEKLFNHNQLREKEEKNNATYIITVATIISSVHLSFIITSRVFMINLPPEQKSLLYPVTVPFDMTNTVYYIVYSLQLITTFFEGTTHITSIAICTGFMNILCAEYTVLGKAFKYMDHLGRQQALQCSGTEMGPGWNPKRHLEHHTQALLRSLVNHHILMINFCKELQATFAVPILEMFLNCQIMLCSCGFHIFKLYEQREIEQLSKQLCMFFALLSHEFVYFWFGSRLTDTARSFRYDVYACGWHDRSPSFKRSYRIVLERIKRRVTIHAFILPVNLITFVKCLQAAFSYFNLLLALSYKQEKLLHHQI